MDDGKYLLDVVVENIRDYLCQAGSTRAHQHRGRTAQQSPGGRQVCVGLMELGVAG